MFAVLISAFNTVLAFVLRKVTVKFLLFGALYWLCTEIPSLIAVHFPDISSVQALFDRMPDGVIYFANYFYVPQGLTAIISALFVRFFIRRIPFLGG
ncbi:TPA: DUF2523 domain-containing protein [Escherichia coli]|nr:DUF2523 domain-containing protein [Escherichia coli]HBA9523029.1 DUF2523 domain-containing protein [Escherichia coli]HBA9551034.1 DUF2523 domain-containing protein [Escherichia coli]HBA9560430.1 DUF2523 domain-containing protein [Escherichia coli]